MSTGHYENGLAPARRAGGTTMLSLPGLLRRMRRQ